jgi:hypothetical protein
MTDIVERLRAHKVPQMHEAAAEIERLRDEVERLSNANDQVWADNERLRAALLKIKRGSVWNCDIEAFIDAALAEEKKDDL